MTVLAVSLLTQNLHCLLVCFAPLLLAPPLLPLFFFGAPIPPSSSSTPPPPSFSSSAANKKQQPLDADVLHLVPPHCQLFCAQHVRGCGGGELSQVSPAAGGGGGAAEGGETTKAIGEKA